MRSTKERKVLRFLQNHRLAVIATANDKDLAPESSLIAFVEDQYCCLYFQTGKNTRKAHNLKKNRYVSLVVGLELSDLATLQYEGIAEQLVDSQAIEDCKTMFVQKKSPTTLEYLEREDAILFKVKPVWASLADYRDKSQPTFTVLEDFRGVL